MATINFAATGSAITFATDNDARGFYRLRK